MRPPIPRSLGLPPSATLIATALAILLIAQPAFAASMEALKIGADADVRKQDDLDRTIIHVPTPERTPTPRDDPFANATLLDMGLGGSLRADRVETTPPSTISKFSERATPQVPSFELPPVNGTATQLPGSRADNYIAKATPGGELHWMGEKGADPIRARSSTWGDVEDTPGTAASSDTQQWSDAPEKAAARTPAPAERANKPAEETASDDYEVKTTTRVTPPGTRGTQSAMLVAAGTIAAALGLAALLPFALYNRLTGHRLLENATRRRVYDAVSARPGISARDTAQEVGVTYSTVVYHLDRLANARLIVVAGSGARVRYYRNGVGINARARELATLLEHAGLRRVLALILEEPGTYRAAIVAKLGVSAATVNWHLKRLIAAGVVEERADGRTTRLHADGARLEEAGAQVANK